MNPGKEFFLRLAADAVRDVNLMRDENGLTYSRKAMIRCGLALDVTGVWHEKQLSRELQLIISKHRKYFWDLLSQYSAGQAPRSTFVITHSKFRVQQLVWATLFVLHHQ
jgi:hypothetical protein